MSNICIKISPLVFALNLVACGGGSSDAVVIASNNPTTAISAANQQLVAAEVSANALKFTGNTLGSIADAALSVATESANAEAIPNMRLIVVSLRDLMRNKAQPLTPQVVAAEVVTTDSCVAGGTMKTTFDDKNANTEWDVNETGTVSFSNCVMQTDGSVINGSVKDEFLLESPTMTTDRFTFTNFKVSFKSLTSELVSGTATYTKTTTGSLQNATLKSADHFVTQALKVKMTVGSGGQSENFTLDEDVTFSQSSPNLTLQTITGTGSINSDNTNINGSVKFDITTPIVVTSSEQTTVSSGQMTISGSGGTALYLTFAMPDTGSVTMKLTKDGAPVGTQKTVSVTSILTTFAGGQALN